MKEINLSYFSRTLTLSLYSVKTQNLCDMYEDKSQFDLNGYSNNSPYYNVENKKKIGKMKDEMGGVLMMEFMRLHVRMYSVLSADLKEKKRQKESIKLL